jgi:hypothetical protein
MSQATAKPVQRAAKVEHGLFMTYWMIYKRKMTRAFHCDGEKKNANRIFSEFPF